MSTLAHARPLRPLRAAALLLALVAALASCVPAASEETEVVTDPTGPLSYAPTATGARWTYLPDRATLDEPRVTMAVEGPTMRQAVRTSPPTTVGPSTMTCTRGSSRVAPSGR